ncbi:Histone deacetylase 6 [Chamberlinius hualienensis]
MSIVGVSNVTGIVYDERMVEHHCLFDPEYPECPERFSFSLQRCRNYGLIKRCTELKSRAATEEEILSIHSQSLIDSVKSSDGCEDRDFLYKLSSKYDAIYFHPSTYELSLLSVGCTVDLVTQIVQGNLKNGMAIIRPPGHHAMKDNACGYCFFNNVAIAAKHALDHLGLKRILIVDWDVHHGQATQFSFYDDPRVLYFSIHRYEHGSFWPELRESNYDYIGSGRGAGYNINVPLNCTGMGNSEYLTIFHQLLLPVAHEFSPELVIVSAGYDAAIGCREGRMEVTPVGYAHLTSMLMTFGKVAVVLEGGYCLKSLAESVALTLRTLLGDPCPPIEKVLQPHQSVVDSVLNCISVLRPYWNCFKLRSVDGENFKTNGWPDHNPVVKYVGNPPADGFEFPVTGFYPKLSDEEEREYDSRIDQLIDQTDLQFPSSRTAIVFDEVMTQHRNYQEYHPERPERVLMIMKALKEHSLLENCKLLHSRRAKDEEILLFHCADILSEVKQTVSMKGRERCQYADKYRSIYLCEQSYTSAITAAGCLLQLVDDVLEGKSLNGAAVIRPPGHHAERDELCGFCIFNNVAIAAKYALNKFQLKKILIVDWDVHHGNGIQNAFYDDPRVLYMSIHRYNNGMFFPGSTEGNYTSVGQDSGTGYNVNIPWNSHGLGNGDYVSAFHQLILPIAYQYQPEVVFISAGFDAAKGDPIGQCQVTAECYAHMTQMLSGLANGKLILALEGGYDLEALSLSFVNCVKVLQGLQLPQLPSTATPSPSAAKTIRDVISVQKQYWSCLQFQVNFPSTETLELEGAVGGMTDEAKPQETIASMLASLQISSNENEVGPFAIEPKTDCPHIQTVTPFNELKFNLKSGCHECKSSHENWICLICYEICCSRYVNGHMMKHFEATEHCISFSFSDFSFWCYHCDSYIGHAMLDEVLVKANLLKFGR